MKKLYEWGHTEGAIGTHNRMIGYKQKVMFNKRSDRGNGRLTQNKLNIYYNKKNETIIQTDTDVQQKLHRVHDRRVQAK